MRLREENVRVETGVCEGQEVSVHYDPMIAKLVVWGRDRTEALAKTRAKLTEYQVAGLETNVNFLLRLSGAKAFVEGDVHTSFIPQHESELFAHLTNEELEEKAIQTALGHLLKSQRDSRPNDSWKGISVEAAGWRLNHRLKKTVDLRYGEKDLKVTVEYGNSANTFKVQVDGGSWKDVEASLRDFEHGLLLTTFTAGKTSYLGLLTHENEVHIYDENGQTVMALPQPKYQVTSDVGSAMSSNSAATPTAGILERVMVKSGDKVEKGQPLFVVIAMKMEYVVRSPRDGVIASVAAVNCGDAVSKGLQIVVLEGLE
ncbi:hypothetical protein ACJJTC_007815 [Scirpophaga incertulas]